MTDPIKAALQNTVSEGWMVTHYVCIASYQRISDEGQMQFGNPVLYCGEQPFYVTEGLLYAADELLREDDSEDEDD